MRPQLGLLTIPAQIHFAQIGINETLEILNRLPTGAKWIMSIHGRGSYKGCFRGNLVSPPCLSQMDHQLVILTVSFHGIRCNDNEITNGKENDR